MQCRRYGRMVQIWRVADAEPNFGADLPRPRLGLAGKYQLTTATNQTTPNHFPTANGLGTNCIPNRTRTSGGPSPIFMVLSHSIETCTM